MLPLADGDLYDFWKRNDPHDAKIRGKWPEWVARQCHGLTLAICKLHDLHESELTKVLSEEPSELSKSTAYGIHGDIKPRNLLWFKEWRGFSSQHHELGVLQVADFGISSMHHTDTRSAVDMRGGTKTYRPPEVETELGLGSRSFDIWSLGCVFLEFLCWLVKGNKENHLAAFSEARKLNKENRGLEGVIIQDTFYHIVKSSTSTRFEVNPEVVKVR